MVNINEYHSYSLCNNNIRHGRVQNKHLATTVNHFDIALISIQYLRVLSILY